MENMLDMLIYLVLNIFNIVLKSSSCHTSHTHTRTHIHTQKEQGKSKARASTKKSGIN
jgi:hypothetical protein